MASNAASVTKKLRRAIQVALDKEFGHDSLPLINQLKKIAFGGVVEVEGEVPGTKKRLSPTIAEMTHVCFELLAYQHGRPTQSLDVEYEARAPKINLDNLTFEELKEFDRLARKAEQKRLPKGADGSNVIEGVFVASNTKTG